MISESQQVEYMLIRPITAQRKRKLQQKGVSCWWSPYANSWVWDVSDMAHPSHACKGLLKSGDEEHGRRKI